MAWKSGRKVPLLPLGHSRPLQTIQLSDLVGCDSPLKIVMAVSPDPESSNSNKKGAKLPLLSADGCHTQLEGQHCPLIRYQGVFFKGVETL